MYKPPAGPPPAYGKAAPVQGKAPPVPAPADQAYGYGASGSGYAPPAGLPPVVVNSQTLMRELEWCVQDQNIRAFYPDSDSLRDIAMRVAESGAIQDVAARWHIPLEKAVKLVKLALFDIVIFVDDSSSMERMEGGARIHQLHEILRQVSYVTSLFDDDGIDVEFINSPLKGQNLTTEASVMALLGQVRYLYDTRLGTQLRNKILQPFARDAARGKLHKPLVVVAITDGAPQGEPKNTIYDVILKTDRELAKTRFGRDAVSYQFAQVGDDVGAQEFLADLDEDPKVGSLVDCTSRYELEAREWMEKTRSPLSREEWLCKLLLGPIDTAYDQKDETVVEKPKRQGSILGRRLTKMFNK